jgi:2-phosphosulfolactate phosphatase
VTSEQARYQVRFDFGVAGANAVGRDADVIVWVDALGGASVDVAALPTGSAVITTGLANARAAADWVMAEQLRLEKRFATAVIAAGADRDGHWRYAVEDHLAAGAVIDRLSELGLDATSPEAAAAEAAYRSLSRAVGHLMTASVSASTGTKVPDRARAVNPEARATEVTVLRGF